MYSSDKNLNNIMTSSSHNFATLSNWFYKNCMVLNPDKCSFQLFVFREELQTYLALDNVTIENSKEEKINRITFDNKLDFPTHLTSITKKTNIKLNILTRVQKYMTPKKKRPS